MIRVLLPIAMLAASTTCICYAQSDQERKTQLLAVQRCPSAASLLQLTAVQSWQDLATCAAACCSVADESQCGGLYYSSTSKQCYHGTAAQFETLWDKIDDRLTSICISYMKDWAVSIRFTESVTSTKSSTTSTPSVITTTPTKTAAATTSTTAAPGDTIPGLSASLTSKLLILFDFRKGYSNLANPARYAITPYGSVSRNADGASFTQPAGAPSTAYLEVDTESGSLTTNFLSDGNSFTFFVRAKRRNWYQTTYHYFYDCSSPASYTGRFADRNGRMWIEHPFPSHARSEVRQSTSGTLLSISYAINLANIGVIFTSGSVTNFYLNGSMQSVGTNQPWAFTASPRCLRLGYDYEPDYGLTGLMVCYAMASANLNLAELQQLEAYCAN